MAELENMLQNAFPSLSPRSVAMISGHCRVRRYARNDAVFFEGDTGDAFFYIHEGTIKIFKTSPAGQETVLRLQGPGSVFAEVILFEQDVYPVTAVAVAPSVLISIPRRHFLALLDEGSFRNEFIATLMHKQRYLTDRIVYLTSFDVEERFFRFLIEHYGVHDLYTLDLSKKDIASAIGTIPETLSRLFDRLKNREAISWDGDMLKVDPDYLQAFIP